MLKVVGITTDTAGCGWYRIRTPLGAAARQGLIELRHTEPSVIKGPLGNFTVCAGWTPTLHAEYPGTPEEEKPVMARMRDFYHMAGDWADILLTQRYTQVQYGAGFQAASKVMGVPWVMDLDDDVFHIDPMNPAARVYRDKKESEIVDVREIESVEEAGPVDLIRRLPDGQLQLLHQKDWDYLKIARRAIILADALIVSTQELADLYGAHRRHNGVEERVFVVPNSLDEQLWSAPTPAPPHPGEVWVGWAGAGSHLADLMHIEKVVDEILRRHPEVRFFWTKLPSPHLLRLSQKWGRRCVRLESWSNIENWADYYTALNFDIALAPLEDTVFTRSKSNLKWLEAGILGQPMVASKCGPYKDTIREGQDGFLASTVPQWIDKVSALVRSPTLRKGIGEAAMRRVLREYSMTGGAARWVSALQTIKDKYGPEIATRAKEFRERGQSDAISDSPEHDPERGAAPKGRGDTQPCEASVPVGAS